MASEDVGEVTGLLRAIAAGVGSSSIMRAATGWARGAAPISQVSLHGGRAIARRRDLDLIALDETLASLESHESRLGQVAILRLFAGMEVRG